MEKFVSNQLTFNTYDIFSNLIPGVVTIVGIWVQFTDFDSLFPSLGIIEILLIIIVAFVLGAGLQATGSALSKIQSDPPAFNQMMDDIYDYVNDPDASDSDNPDRVDGMQVKFYNACKSTFGFNEGRSCVD